MTDSDATIGPPERRALSQGDLERLEAKIDKLLHAIEWRRAMVQGAAHVLIVLTAIFSVVMVVGIWELSAIGAKVSAIENVTQALASRPIATNAPQLKTVAPVGAAGGNVEAAQQILRAGASTSSFSARVDTADLQKMLDPLTKAGAVAPEAVKKLIDTAIEVGGHVTEDAAKRAIARLLEPEPVSGAAGTVIYNMASATCSPAHSPSSGDGPKPGSKTKIACPK